MPTRHRKSVKRPAAGSVRKAAAASPRRRGRGFAAVVLSCLLAAASFFAAAWLLLVPPPEPMPNSIPADALVQQRILAKVSGEVFSRNPPAESEMRLSPVEVNALLRFAVFAVTAAEHFGSIDRRIAERIRAGNYAYRDGVFFAEVPLARVAPGWFFGGNAVVCAAGFPAKYDGKFDVSIRACRFGRLPVPAAWAERFVNRRFGALPGREDMLRFDRAVKSFEPAENGDVIVVYRPPELLRLLIGGMR